MAPPERVITTTCDGTFEKSQEFCEQVLSQAAIMTAGCLSLFTHCVYNNPGVVAVPAAAAVAANPNAVPPVLAAPAVAAVAGVAPPHGGEVLNLGVTEVLNMVPVPTPAPFAQVCDNVEALNAARTGVLVQLTGFVTLKLSSDVRREMQQNNCTTAAHMFHII